MGANQVSARKTISKSSSTELHGLLNGTQKIDESGTTLQVPSKIPFKQIRTVPTNPRYDDLCTALIVQPKFETASGTPRHYSSAHVYKLSRQRAFMWAQKARTGWFLSANGKAWLASEAKHGHKFNFDEPTDADRDIIWKAYMRRWYERVERMLKRRLKTAEDTRRYDKLLEQWNELIALAANIARDGLTSPVRVRPMGGEYDIVGGERRYWACRLASMDHIPVMGGAISDMKAMSQTLHENLDRLDISRSGWVKALRLYMAQLTGESCGPKNKQLTIAIFQNEFAGRSRSWANRWRGICRLPEDSKLLASILSGELTGVNEIDKAVREYHKLGKAGENPEALDDDQQESPTLEPGMPNPVTPKPAPQKPAPAIPAAKARLPGTVGGLRMLDALKGVEGINDGTKESIGTAMEKWRVSNDTVRRKMLEDIFSSFAADLDKFDDEN